MRRGGTVGLGGTERPSPRKSGITNERNGGEAGKPRSSGDYVSGSTQAVDDLGSPPLFPYSIPEPNNCQECTDLLQEAGQSPK